MRSTMYSVSSIVISKTDMETFGIINVEVTTSDGEKLKLSCFHDTDVPISIETGE
jgi:hypothetical protein